MTITGRKRLVLLVCIVGSVVMINAGITIVLLYDAAWEAQQARLVETVRSQACLIEAVADFRHREETSPGDVDWDWKGQTLSQVRDAVNRFERLGQTSEFTLATREDNRIIFLIRLRHEDPNNAGELALELPWSGDAAEPMRRALSGQSGVVVGRDYRDVQVLAAYEPLPGMGWGIVAKIDVSEIRSPFIKAGGIAAAFAIIAVFSASTLIIRWTEPVIRDFEESETRAKAILEGAQDGILTFNADGSIESYNPAAQRMFNYVNRRLDGVNVSELLRFQDASSGEAGTPQALSGELLDSPGRRRSAVGCRENGTTFPVEATVSAAVLADRQLYTVVVSDTTEHQNVRQVLRESKTFLQTIIDSLPDGLMVIDLNHQVLLANKTIREQLRHRSSDESCFVCYRSSHRRDTPCDGPQHPCPMREVVRTKAPIVVEHVHIDAEGREFPVEIVAAPVFDASGEVVQIIECCRDLTERRLAEDRLRESELRLRELYEASRDGYAMVDLQTGRLLDFNSAFREMTGFSEDQLRDKTYQELTPEEWHETENRIIQEQVLTRGYSDLYEKEYRRKDGVVFPAEVQRYLCKDKLGRPVSMWAFVRNVAERKSAEEALRTVNTELAARNEEISQLVYTVSHDLKSPLVTIQGFAGRIHRDAAAGKVDCLSDYVQRVQNAAERMGRLLDDLLEFNRIGRISGQPEWVNLTELAHEIIAGQEIKLRNRDVAIRVQEDMPIVFGDRGRLGQLLDNLLGNAINYGSDACDAEIQIGAVEPDEGEVHLFVQDNGPGIPAEFHDRIFELFQRLRHDSPGSGAGLSIVKRIAEVHGGHAWVESEPGHGATFWVSLMQPAGIPEECPLLVEVAKSE